MCQLATLLPLVDKNGSGDLSLEEFLMLTVFLRFTKIQFLLADTDGGGTLDRGEVGRHLPALGLQVDEATLNKLIDQLDTDKSGNLSFEEFAMLAAMIKLG